MFGEEWIANLMYPDCLRLVAGGFYARVQLVFSLISHVSMEKDLSKQQQSVFSEIMESAYKLACQLGDSSTTRKIEIAAPVV